MSEESQKIDGRIWLINHNWTRMDKLQKLWFGGQVERYVKKFDLAVDDIKLLKYEIAERWRGEASVC